VTRSVVFGLPVVLLSLGVGLICWRFQTDMAATRLGVSQGSTVIETPCGAIEYQETGTGLPLLASASEQARVASKLDHILPVSACAAGLRNDTATSKSLNPAALGKIPAPTLIISARDDLYGTYASAEYTASQIAGARFLGFDTGGHTWVGHNEEVMAAILALRSPQKGLSAP
jgi:pimeloyl-ACP methyl ester carboxylesterase